MSGALDEQSIEHEAAQPRYGPSVLPLAAVVAAVAYWQRWSFDSKSVSILLKMTPAAVMALEVARVRGMAAWPLTLALALHAVGDGLLDLGNRWLLAGMAAFFLGHLAYIGAFAPYRMTWRQLSHGRRAGVSTLVAAMFGLSVWIWPRLPPILNIASPIYALALTAMAVAAFLGRWQDALVPLGALLFVVSDALLGLRMFADQQTLAPLIWPTYVAAQVGMPVGFLRTAPQVRMPEPS